ncbi:hypothetical protein [Leeia sp.]|uniref:hypothetical protein n=1 Tax=Leeia sp. TaxID=2884678 RepID=UPI0035AFEFE4
MRGAETEGVLLLYQSLQQRLRPEDVAEKVLVVLQGRLRSDEERLLARAARGALKQGTYSFSSMPTSFLRPSPPIRQIHKARELFADVMRNVEPDVHEDIEQLQRLVYELSQTLHMRAECHDFKQDRLSRALRVIAGLELSKRRYNKLFRFLGRLEEKLKTFQFEQRKYAVARMAKTGLATLITWEDFSASVDAACFIAYFSATKNRRSVFSNEGQQSAYDEIADMLFRRCSHTMPSAGWRAIAHVFPDECVVARLSGVEKLTLYMTFLQQLHEIADLLRLTWTKSAFRRDRMVVQRGDDSSTWNALAGAWNAMRQAWLTLAISLGMSESIDAMCLGKVMRLMAADVVAWHRMSGKGLDPDTCVWAALPAPWDVLSGEAKCTRQFVEAACAMYGVDPVGQGWTGPKVQRGVVPFAPTPELVHGVAIAHPGMALLMRKLGWFSGKQ